MTASEFDWWLLIVGLVVGAGLVWLVLADLGRRETETTEDELPREAEWIAARLGDAGVHVEPAEAEEVLRLHRAWLAGPADDRATRPPEDGHERRDEPDGADAAEVAEGGPGPGERPNAARGEEPGRRA